MKTMLAIVLLLSVNALGQEFQWSAGVKRDYTVINQVPPVPIVVPELGAIPIAVPIVRPTKGGAEFVRQMETKFPELRATPPMPGQKPSR